MITKIPLADMGSGNHGWLKSIFHFSFAEYYNMRNMRFGHIRVINDDLIAPKMGFPKHPHKNMEIVTYVINGELTHEDTLGGKGNIKRGEVQYISAGTGVEHSEYNMGNETTRLLQIWIMPNALDLTPAYGEKKYKWEDRKDQFLHIVSSLEGNAPIKVNQNVDFFVTFFTKEFTQTLLIKENQQAYIVQIEATSIINGQKILEKEGAKIIAESINISGNIGSHVLVIVTEVIDKL